MTDDDRERAVRDLTRHCGDGRLTLDELEDRIGLVYAATTEAELALAFRELPPFRLEPAAPARPIPATRAPVPAAHPARRARPASAARRGACGLGGPPVLLIALITILFVTAHVGWALLLLVFVLPKRLQRSYARA